MWCGCNDHTILPVPMEGKQKRFGIMNTDETDRIDRNSKGKTGHPKNTSVTSMGVYIFNWKQLCEKCWSQTNRQSNNVWLRKDVNFLPCWRKQRLAAMEIQGYWKGWLGTVLLWIPVRNKYGPAQAKTARHKVQTVQTGKSAEGVSTISRISDRAARWAAHIYNQVCHQWFEINNSKSFTTVVKNARSWFGLIFECGESLGVPSIPPVPSLTDVRWYLRCCRRPSEQWKSNDQQKVRVKYICAIQSVLLIMKTNVQVKGMQDYTPSITFFSFLGRYRQSTFPISNLVIPNS